MTTTDRCRNCGAEMDTLIFLYCSNCGMLNDTKASDESIVCDTHAETRAIGFCVVCGKAVCNECAENINNRLLCSDPDHREYCQSWKVLHTFDFEYEAAMLYANLELQGIETLVFSKLNPNSAEASVRPTLIEVLVQSHKYNSALEVRTSLGLFSDGEES